jgi:hypothetical protein
MKFNLKLLHIKCHVLGFTKGKGQKVLQRIIRVFAKAFVSHDWHTLFALEESGPPRTTYICESQWEPSPHRSGSPTDSSTTDLSASPEGGRSSRVAGRRRKILTCTQINKSNKSNSLSDYTQQDLSVATRRPRILNMQGFK